MPSTEIMKPESIPVANTLPEMLSLAKVLLDSKFLPVTIKTPQGAVAIILKGRELGIPTMQALSHINIIQGKPTMSAELMLGLAKQRAGVACRVVESDDTHCVLAFLRPGEKEHVETFTAEDAKKLGLWGKDNWNKQPKTMLRWRCVSAGLRFYAPDALGGVSYTPDELGARVTDDGDVIDLPADLPEEPLPQEVETPSTKNFKFMQEMEKQKARLGDAAYYKLLGQHGYTHCSEILDRLVQLQIWKQMQEHDAGELSA